MSGLLLAMFVAMLSRTVVANALPVDRHTTCTARSPATRGWSWPRCSRSPRPRRSGASSPTCSTRRCWSRPRWSSSRRAPCSPAFSTSMEMLIAARVVQGVGVGGLTALVQIVIASIVAPRERGRYTGYLGATFARRHRQRPADRRPDRRHPLAGLALVLLRGRAVRGRRVRRTPAHPAPAHGEAQGRRSTTPAPS